MFESNYETKLIKLTRISFSLFKECAVSHSNNCTCNCFYKHNSNHTSLESAPNDRLGILVITTMRVMFFHKQISLDDMTLMRFSYIKQRYGMPLQINNECLDAIKFNRLSSYVIILLMTVIGVYAQVTASIIYFRTLKMPKKHMELFVSSRASSIVSNKFCTLI